MFIRVLSFCVFVFAFMFTLHNQYVIYTCGYGVKFLSRCFLQITTTVLYLSKKHVFMCGWFNCGRSLSSNILLPRSTRGKANIYKGIYDQFYMCKTLIGHTVQLICALILVNQSKQQKEVIRHIANCVCLYAVFNIKGISSCREYSLLPKVVTRIFLGNSIKSQRRFQTN